MVIDTSALLAVFLNEKHSSWVVSQLNANQTSLRMSTVNMAELLILLQDRQPQIFSQLEEEIFQGPIRFVAPTMDHARTAALARHKHPLNLGDCFAYALAFHEGCPLLTLDKDFKRVNDIDVLIP